MKHFFLPVLLLLCTYLAESQVNLVNGLVASYPFNGNANDATINGNNGSVSNATLTTDRFGTPNSAYNFNGSSSYIRIPNSASLQMGSNVTFAAYIKVNSFYGGMCHYNSIISKGATGQTSGYFSLGYDDGYYTGGQNCNGLSPNSTHETFYGPASQSISGTPVYIVPGQWYYVVYTYDGTTAKTYVDGTLQTAVSYAGLAFNNFDDLFIGRHENPSYPYLVNGSIDEVRLYNRTLTSSEVAALGNCTNTVITSQPVNSTLYGSGNTRFSIAATNATSYKWQVKNGSTWNDIINNSTYSGATSDTLVVTGVTNSLSNSQYRAVVSNSCNVVTSSAATLYYVNLNDGLIAFYPFSGNANDVSGTGNHGTVTNATLTTDRYGNSNSAYAFNGTNAFIKVLNSPSLQFNNKLSISAYVKVQGFYTGVCHSNSILGKASSDQATGAFGIRFDDGLYTNYQNCSGGAADVTHENISANGAVPTTATVTYLVPNQWYHMVYIYDGSTAKLYLNGTLQASGTYSSMLNNSDPLYFGRHENPSFPYWFNGTLDDIRIYNRPINQAELDTLIKLVTPYTFTPELSGLAADSNQVTINWLSNIPSGANTIKVFRSTSPFDTTTVMSPITDTVLATSLKFIDNNVTNQTRYYYRIKLVYTNGSESPFSNLISAIPHIKPSAPSIVKLSVAPGRSRLDWSKVTGGISGYKIYRRQTLNELPVVLAQNIADTMFVDSATTRGQIYYYSVTSADTLGGTSIASNEINKVTPVIWYVDTTGNNTSGIGSLEFPYKTITTANTKSLNGDSIIVKPGTYSEILTVSKFLTIGSMYTLTGDKKYADSTIINASGITLTLINQTVTGSTFNRFRLQGFTIKNSTANVNLVSLSRGGELNYMKFINNGLSSTTTSLISTLSDDIKIENSVFENNSYRSIIYTNYISSNPITPAVISNCIFNNNNTTSSSYGALSLNSAAKLSNLLITKTRGLGGAISIWSQSTSTSNVALDTILINHVTVSQNATRNITIAGHKNSYLKILNSISAFGPSSQNISFTNFSIISPGKPKVIFQGFVANEALPAINASYFDTTSSSSVYIDDPSFTDTSAANNYNLLPRSVAIGKGLADINNPAKDLSNDSRPFPAGSLPDIGAYESILSSQKPSVKLLSVTAGNKKDTLRWVVAPDNLAINKYQLYRDTTANPTTLLADSIGKNSISYIDSVGLLNGKTYYYKIRAVDTLGVATDLSNEKSATPFNRLPIASTLSNEYLSIGRNLNKLVTLSSSGSYDPDGPLDSTIWYLNGIRTASGTSVQINVPQGTNTVSYTVFDKDGGTATATCTRTYYAGNVTTGNNILTGLSGFNKNNIFYADVVNSSPQINRLDSLLNPNYDGGPSVTLVNNAIISAPSLTPDSIMFIANGSSLDAFRITGIPYFASSASLGGNVQVVPTIDTSLKRVYLGLSSGSWLALGYANQAAVVRWSYFAADQTGGFSSPGVITPDRKLIYTTTSGVIRGFELDSMNINSPVPKWNLSTGRAIKKSLAVDGAGDVFITDDLGTIHKYKLAANGTISELWNKSLLSGKYNTSVVIDAFNNIFAGSDNGKIYKLAGLTGDTLWSFNTNAAISATPALSRYGTVYCGNTNGELYAISSTSGAKKWMFKMDVTSAINAHLLHISGATYFTTATSKKIYQLWDKPDDVPYGARATATAIDGTSTLEPVWSGYQGDYRRSGSSKTTTLKFIGNGNWNIAGNWENGIVPPYDIMKGYKIIIDPEVTGECIIDTEIFLQPGSILTVAPGKTLTIKPK